MTDERLVRRLHRLVDRGNALTAELLAHMGEVDRRRLYLQAACPSMFAYCTDVLRMSEAQAYKHIRVARLAREFPAVLPLVHEGRLHLCALVLLAPHLTEENADELMQEAAHKTKRQVEKLVASRFPAPPVPDCVRKLPRRSAERKEGGTPANEPLLMSMPASKPPASGPTMSVPHVERTSADLSLLATRPATATRRKGRASPLSSSEYKVQFTANESLHDKLNQARELLRHRVPDGDLAAVFERALDALLPQLRKERFAEVSRPRRPSSDEPPTQAQPGDHGPAVACDETDPGVSLKDKKRSRHIPAEVRRQVAERDGHQCTYVDTSGRRCPERGLVEFHHVRPFGKGGGHEVDNIRLLCRAHNTGAARHDYGEQLMERWRSQRTEDASPSTRPGASRQPHEAAATNRTVGHRGNRDTG